MQKVIIILQKKIKLNVKHMLQDCKYEFKNNYILFFKKNYLKK